MFQVRFIDWGCRTVWPISFVYQISVPAPWVSKDGIALDPNSATSYECLAEYFITSKSYEEAARLLRFSRTLPGAEVPPAKIVELEDYLRTSRP